MNRFIAWALSLGVFLSANCGFLTAGPRTSKEMVAMSAVIKMVDGKKATPLERTMLKALMLDRLDKNVMAILSGDPKLVRSIIKAQFKSISVSTKYSGREVLKKIDQVISKNEVLDADLIKWTNDALLDSRSSGSAGTEYAPPNPEPSLSRRKKPNDSPLPFPVLPSGPPSIGVPTWFGPWPLTDQGIFDLAHRYAKNFPLSWIYPETPEISQIKILGKTSELAFVRIFNSYASSDTAVFIVVIRFTDGTVLSEGIEHLPFGPVTYKTSENWEIGKIQNGIN